MSCRQEMTVPHKTILPPPSRGDWTPTATHLPLILSHACLLSNDVPRFLPAPPSSRQDAVRDMLYLKESNDELRLKLKQAVDWDLDIR